VTEWLLALCRSPKLGQLMPVYHRLFNFAKEQCSTVDRLKDMREICLAGLRVYTPTPDTHAARSKILFTLGRCYDAELDFKRAVEVSPGHVSSGLPLSPRPISRVVWPP
jgi:hypothetical protein